MVTCAFQRFSNLPLSSVHYGPIPPLIHNYQLLHSMTDSHPQLPTLLPNHQHSALVWTLPLYLLTPLVCTVLVHSAVPGHYIQTSSSGSTIFWLLLKFNSSMKYADDDYFQDNWAVGARISVLKRSMFFSVWPVCQFNKLPSSPKWC